MEDNALKELEDRLSSLRAGFNIANSDNFRPQVNFWARYNDSISRMTLEQLQWTSEQKSVIDAKNKMYAAFFDFLFEQNKEMFVSVNNGQYKEIAGHYIDTIQSTAGSYVSHAKQLEEQVKELQEKIKTLEGARHVNSGNCGNTKRNEKNKASEAQNEQQFELCSADGA